MIIRRLFTVFSLLFVVCLVQGQTPRPLTVRGKIATEPQQKSDMMCGNAGEINISVSGQTSSSSTSEPIILCFGDMLTIDHIQGTEDLTNDPDASTTPGVAYAIYTCKPTIGGDDLASIRMDGCLLDNQFQTDANGTIVNTISSYGMWLIGEDPSGDLVIDNDNALNIAFNNGNVDTFWFAPITVDFIDADDIGFESNNQTSAGACVNVREDQAFSVIYLNEITIEPARSDYISPDIPCEARMIIKGGQSEIDASDYDVTITSTTDPTAQGTIRNMNSPIHGRIVVFDVEANGEYEVRVEDTNGCVATTTITFTNCSPPAVTASDLATRQGEEICMSILAEDLLNVQTLQFDLIWDDNILAYKDSPYFHPDLLAAANNPASGLGSQSSSNTYTFTWNDDNASPNGLSIPDGDTVMVICFTAIGSPGSMTPITFGNKGAGTSVNGVSISTGLRTVEGSITIADMMNIQNFSVINPTCNALNNNGQSTGGFTITIENGAPPYTLSYRDRNTPGQTPIIISDAVQENQVYNATPIPAGDYILFIEDSSTPSELEQRTLQIIEPDAFTVGINTVKMPTCSGDMDAQLEARVVRGNVQVSDPVQQGFSFMWNDMSTGIQLNNVGAGQYEVTVTDADGCVAEATDVVGDPQSFSVFLDNRAPSCSGAQNGFIKLVAVPAGSNPNNPMPTPISGLTTYEVFNPDGTLLKRDVTDQTSQINNVEEGSYTYTVTNANGCQENGTFDMIPSKTLTIAVADSSHVKCNGESDAFIELSASTIGQSLSGNWQFTWSGTPSINGNPATTTGNISRLDMLPRGQYNVTITDDGDTDCEIFASYTIGEPSPITIMPETTTPEGCNNAGNGTATLDIAGGVQPYNYIWSDGVQTTMATRNNLSAGAYNVQIRDANGCQDDLSLVVPSSTPPTVNIDDFMLGCGTETNGRLTAMVTQGSSNITSTNWSTGDTGNTITNLGTGTYTVTVTAADGCTAEATGEITAPVPVSIDSLIAEAPNCPEGLDAELTVYVNPNSGVAPYQYRWFNDQGINIGNADRLASVGAGNYRIEVVDANGCTSVSDTKQVDDPPSIIIDTMQTATTSVSCNNASPCDGNATVVAVYDDGTSGTFDFQWESGEATTNSPISTAQTLCQGFRSVSITDGKCVAVDSVFIDAPSSLGLNVSATPVRCFGGSDGMATVLPVGGTGNYNIVWDDMTVGDTNDNLSEGSYTVTVTDANNCEFSSTVTIQQPDTLTALIDPVQTRDVTCEGSTDGVISIAATGGNDVEDYTYSIMPMAGNINSTNAIIENLPPGDYTVTVEDVRGCQSTVNYTVVEPQAVEVDLITIPEPQCFNQQTAVIIDPIDVYGGNGGPYTFSVNNFTTQSINNTFPLNINGLQDSIMVSVFDSRMCRFDTTLVVSQPQQVQVVFEQNSVELQLGDELELIPNIIGDFPIDGMIPGSIVWTPPTALSDSSILNPVVRPISSQEYTLTVTDINGCSGSGSVFIDVDKDRKVYIPNVITPDGDGWNDEFIVGTGLGVKTINYVRIYDRWGSLIHANEQATSVLDNSGNTRVWDGRINGQVVGTGVYVYIVEVTFEDDLTLLYRGDFSVFR